MSVKNSSIERELYFDLLKRSLLNWIYSDAVVALDRTGTEAVNVIDSAHRDQGVQFLNPEPFDQDARRNGKDWPVAGMTMVGRQRLDNIQACVEQVLEDGIDGDLIETGVWRGGSVILMRAVLKAHGVNNRTVWAADSFEGLPVPDAVRYPVDNEDTHHTFDFLKVSQEEVKQNFERYGLLDDQVKFLKGWFRDTLPTAPIDKLAVVRLDGDMYESTMVGLTSLYPKLSAGGFLIVDDYGCLEGCRQAVHDYRQQHEIKDRIVSIDWTGVYWRKS